MVYLHQEQFGVECLAQGYFNFLGAAVAQEEE